MAFKTMCCVGLLAIACSSARTIAQDRWKRVIQQPQDFRTYVVYTGAAARFDELLRPDFRRSDLRLFAESLDLDETQKTILQMLIDEYQADFELSAQELRDAMGRIRGPQPRALAGGLIIDQYFRAEPQFLIDGSSQAVLSYTIDARDMAQGGTDGRDVVVLRERLAQDNDAATDARAFNDRRRAEREAAAQQAADAAREATEESKDIDIERLRQLEAAQTQLERHMDARIQTLRERVLQLRAAEEARQLDPQEVAKIARSFRNDKQTLRSGFIADLSTILSDHQLSRIELALGFVQCTNDLPRGRFGGESLNVSQLMDTLAAPESINEQTIGATEDAWFIATAAALHRRSEILIDHEIEMLELMAEDDTDKRIRMAQREADGRVVIREMNHAAVVDLTQAMHPEESQALTMQALRLSFPRILNPTASKRALDAALELPGLDEAAFSAIQAVRDDYIVQCDLINHQLVASTREEEPRQAVDRLEYSQALQSVDFTKITMAVDASDQFATFELPEPPMMKRTNELYEQRRELGIRTLRQLAGILTSEQLDALPIPDRDKALARGRDLPGQQILHFWNAGR